MSDVECYAELELMQAAYPGKVDISMQSSTKGLSFATTLDFKGIILRFCIPFEFPNESIRVTVDGNISNYLHKTVSQSLEQALMINPTIGCMELCQCAADKCQDIDMIRETEIETNNINLVKNIKIGRFLIYFHHIMRYMTQS